LRIELGRIHFLHRVLGMNGQRISLRAFRVERSDSLRGRREVETGGKASAEKR